MHDIHRIQSAIAQPRHCFGDELAYPSLAEMASAYAYYLARSHGFIDGNKRTASIVALVFLDLNPCPDIAAYPASWTEIMVGVVERTVTREQLTEHYIQLLGGNSYPVVLDKLET